MSSVAGSAVQVDQSMMSLQALVTLLLELVVSKDVLVQEL